MIRPVSNSFRNDDGPPFNINLGDDLMVNASLFPGAPSWTQGATLIDNVPLSGRGQTQGWTVKALSVTANLVLKVASPSPFVPMFGKLGKIYTGLTIGPPTGTSSAGYQEGIIAFPYDQTKVTVLWDPAVDALPPIVPVAPGVSRLAVAASLSPPQDLQVVGGSTLGVGIWVMPALVTNAGQFATAFPGVQMTVCDAGYTVIYDDSKLGQGPVG